MFKISFENCRFILCRVDYLGNLFSDFPTVLKMRLWRTSLTLIRLIRKFNLRQNVIWTLGLSIFLKAYMRLRCTFDLVWNQSWSLLIRLGFLRFSGCLKLSLIFRGIFTWRDTHYVLINKVYIERIKEPSYSYFREEKFSNQVICNKTLSRRICEPMIGVRRS